MYINKKKNNKKHLILALGIILATILIYGAVSYSYTLWPFSKEASAPQKKYETSETAKDKAATQKNETSQDSKRSSSNPADISTSDRVPTSTNMALTITDFRQANHTVYATAQITGSNSIGKCVFTYTTSGSRPVVQEVIGTATECVASTPEVQFDQIGSWHLKVVFYTQNTKVEGDKDVVIN